MLCPAQHSGSLQLFRTTAESWRSSSGAKRSVTIHTRANERLALELEAQEGLTCRFHGGVAWRSTEALLSKGRAVVVQTELALRIGPHRYVPDLTIRCLRTWRILLLIEVWESHAVSVTKARALGMAEIPWIEVKARHVLARRRSCPLAVLDWGGPGLPNSPCQGQI